MSVKQALNEARERGSKQRSMPTTQMLEPSEIPPSEVFAKPAPRKRQPKTKKTTAPPVSETPAFFSPSPAPMPTPTLTKKKVSSRDVEAELMANIGTASTPSAYAPSPAPILAPAPAPKPTAKPRKQAAVRKYRRTNTEAPHVDQSTKKPTFTYPRDFRCDVSCMQCEYTYDNGDQCANTVCSGLPYCPHHLKQKYGLVVKPSGLRRGVQGVFAAGTKTRKTAVFAEGDVICRYKLKNESAGRMLESSELVLRYGDDAYSGKFIPYLVAIDMPDHRGMLYLDGACNRSVVTMVAVGDSPNVDLEYAQTSNGDDALLLRANRPIAAGEELVTSYNNKNKYYKG